MEGAMLNIWEIDIGGSKYAALWRAVDAEHIVGELTGVGFILYMYIHRHLPLHS